MYLASGDRLTQALQIMNLRNFVTNIMITKLLRETRYQYNDHEDYARNSLPR
jgi:hypothetical protein